jgi:hypothetical protein
LTNGLQMSLHLFQICLHRNCFTKRPCITCTYISTGYSHQKEETNPRFSFSFNKACEPISLTNNMSQYFNNSSPCEYSCTPQISTLRNTSHFSTRMMRLTGIMKMQLTRTQVSKSCGFNQYLLWFKARLQRHVFIMKF